MLKTKDFKGDNVKIKILKEEGEGIIEAYVSIFGNVDSYGEVVDKGAFAESLKKKLPKGVWSHNWQQPIAKTLEAREDSKGLYIKGKLILAVQKAKEVYELLKAGVIDEFSFGFRVDEEDMDDDGIKHLKKIRIYEWSPVLVGANPDTELVSIKSECLNCNHKFKFEKSCEGSKCPECGSSNIKAEKKPDADEGEKPAPEITENYIRWRIKNPAYFDPESLRTITISASKGIKAVVGCKKGNYSAGKCKIGVEIQAYLFDKDKWTVEKARVWIAAHKPKSVIDLILIICGLRRHIAALKRAGEGRPEPVKIIRIREAIKRIDKDSEFVLRILKK